MNKALVSAFLTDVAAVVVGLLVYSYVKAYLVQCGWHPESTGGAG